MDNNQHPAGFAAEPADATEAISLQPATSADKIVAVVGSHPELSADFVWPKDKGGVAMRFVAQIDFAALAAISDHGEASNPLPERGLLSLFCADPLSAFSPKDRKAFHIVYQPSACFDQQKAGDNRWTVGKNSPGEGRDASANLLLGQDCPGLERQKEIAAFAASGISHSAARAADEHYSHLMAEVHNWILLGQLGGMRLLIRRDDLAARLFERAWLLDAH